MTSTNIEVAPSVQYLRSRRCLGLAALARQRKDQDKKGDDDYDWGREGSEHFDDGLVQVLGETEM